MNRFHRQSGLTLVELMVATTLSLVLLAGVLLVFSANKTTYQMQNGMGTLQENGRFAVSKIAADLRQAGFAGCQSPHLEPRVINHVTSTPALDGFSEGNIFDGRNDPSGTVTISAGGVSIDMLPGTDSLEIRGPLNAEIVFVRGTVTTAGPITIAGTSTPFGTANDLLIADCSSATLFRYSSSTVTGGNTQLSLSEPLAQPYGADAQVMSIQRHTYFVGVTTRQNFSRQQVSALYRLVEDGTNRRIEELVEGVENLQISYSFDSDNDGVVDALGTGEKIEDGTYGWDQVMAVHLALLLNSVEGASSSEISYTYFPASTTPISPATDDYRMRQEFSSLISIRNAVF